MYLKGCINCILYFTRQFIEKGEFMLTFILGIGIGTLIGMVIMAIMVSAKKGGEIRDQVVLNIDSRL
jgi:hypothetical protein